MKRYDIDKQTEDFKYWKQVFWKDIKWVIRAIIVIGFLVALKYFDSNN
jgi:hypothetical protein